MKMSCLAGLTGILAAAGAGQVAASQARVVILSGQTVHDVAETTPFLKQMYDGCKKFKVVAVVDDVSKVKADTFAKCDVIVSNWTCFPTMTGGPWTAEGKKALEDAIRSGKGMVQFHAATAACNDWPAFQQISGLSWKADHSSHTSYHTLKVSVSDASHPITRGLPDFWIKDELYQKLFKFTPSDFKVYMQSFSEQQFGGTGAWEPVLITTQLGKGRGVYFVLGHDLQTMKNIAWQTIMLRATEWAGKGHVTISIPEGWPTSSSMAEAVGIDVDAALKAAAEYRFGDAYQPRFAVEQLVNASTSDTGKHAAAGRASLAVKLAAMIPQCKTTEGESFFCKQLAMIGGPEQVPAVVPLLADAKTAMMARFALERIGGPAATKALREAAKNLQGGLRLGAVNSLGVLADAEAVPLLEPMLKDADAELASAASAALGKIGTAQAAQVLRAARTAAGEALKPTITDACFTCAERLLAAKDKESAGEIYCLLYGPAEPALVRAAALHGLVEVQPHQQTMLIKEALDSKLPQLQQMAAYVVRTMPSAGDTRAIAEYAVRLKPAVQLMMIPALGERGNKGAINSLQRAATDDNEQVRAAAKAALKQLGVDLGGGEAK